LEHLLSCCKIASFLSTIYPVNESYVVAGTLLHDLCKMEEISSLPVVDYTDDGKLLGHLVLAFELLDKECEKIPSFPKDMKMHLKHILASHHGEHEYGSPKLPHTTEAMMVYLIDLMDSKINSFETAKKADNSEGNWTGLVKPLNRIIYKAPLPTYDTISEVDSSGPFASLKNLKV